MPLQNMIYILQMKDLQIPSPSLAKHSSDITQKHDQNLRKNINTLETDTRRYCKIKTTVTDKLSRGHGRNNNK